MKMSINCPHCSEPYNIVDPKVNDKWDCPHCGKRAVINKVTETTEETTTIRKTNYTSENAFSGLFG